MRTIRTKHASACLSRGVHAHLDSVKVDEDFRGQGYGRKLMEFVLGKAREAGATTVDLCVYASNTPAVRLYESLGFVGRPIEATDNKVLDMVCQLNDLMAVAA